MNLALLALLVPLLTTPPLTNEPDPHGGAATWLSDPPLEQAAMDKGIPPAATGAIFVPEMTYGLREPIVLIMRGEEAVAAVNTGTKAWVKPGDYEVLVGSGAPESRLRFAAHVVEGETTFIPVDWGGLRITVSNERGTPFRGSYELVRLPEREFFGLGLGAATAEGEVLSTWLLPPGKYLILSAGESYRARKNFTTVRILPGELVQFTLVLDEATGDMLGGGEVSDDQASATTGPWSISLILGGTLAFNRSDDVVGKADGMSLDLGAFFEMLGGYRDDNHIAYGRLYVEEEGLLILPEGPYTTVVDTLDVDLLYMWRYVPWFGPYGRASMETQMVPGLQRFDDPTDVQVVDPDGVILETRLGQKDVELTPPFSPIDVRYGAGGRFDIAPVYWFSLQSRLGLGARHLFARDLFIVTNPSAPYQVRRASDLHQFGFEASLITELRLTRWVLFKVESDLLLPFDDAANPVLDLKATVAFRLASFASLNYTIRVQRDPALTHETPIDQSILLRFAYKVL